MSRALALLVVLAAALTAVVNGVAALAAARHLRRHPPSCPPDDADAPRFARIVAALRVFLGECIALLCAMLAPPPRSRLDGRPGPRRPVVLLHDRGLHRGSLRCLAGRLRRDGWSEVFSVRHQPLADLEGSAARVAAALARIRAAARAEVVDVVAHGTGGLAARACIRAAGRASGVGRLVTLGTPHQGTTGPFASAGERPGAPWLAALRADDPIPALVDCTAIYSADDARVIPAGNGYYPGAFNVEVRGIGHTALVFSARVYELVCENLLAEPEAGHAVGRR